MTIPMWCLVAGVFLPYIWAFSSVPYRLKQFGQVDINTPRVQADALTDAGHRVWGAQSNAWEALTVFAVATLIGFMAGLDPSGHWATASLIWLAARIAHGAFYIAGVATLRVISFTTGLGMSLWIVFMAI